MRRLSFYHIGVIFTLLISGCTLNNTTVQDRTNEWNKYHSILQSFDNIEMILPFTKYINKNAIENVNIETVRHAMTIRTQEYTSRKNTLNATSLIAISEPVDSNAPNDTIGSIKLDTFALHYGISVLKDTSFGILVFTNNKKLILQMAFKVYKDTMGYLTEESALYNNINHKIINAKMTAIEDTLIHGTWAFRDSSKNTLASFEGFINLKSKEVPKVYTDIENYIILNDFLSTDSSDIPIELLNEFCKQINEKLDSIKATSGDLALGALSTSIFYFATRLMHYNPSGIYGWLVSLGAYGINEFMIWLYHLQHTQNPDTTTWGNIDWEEFCRNFWTYMQDYFHPVPPDATGWIWYNWNGGN